VKKLKLQGLQGFFWKQKVNSKMEIINDNFKPKAKSDIKVKTVDEEKVLFNPENSSIHVLNKTAYPVWKLADGTNTIEKIIKEISIMFDNPDENFNILEDVHNIIAEFKKLGLIE